MIWQKLSVAVVLISMFSSCVEQEPARPTAEDIKIIKQNILTSVPKMKFPVNADLEGKATYLGLDVDKDSVQPGVQFTLTHYWKVVKKIDDWNIFVHLSGPNNRNFINADHTPIQGRYPVSQWKEGEIIRDEHQITLPNNWDQPQLFVYTGLWKGKLRMRPTTGTKDAENRIIAAKIPVVTANKGEKPKPKHLVAIKTAKPIKVDGKLDEEVWTKAASSGVFVNTMSGEPVPFKTEVKVAYDKANLYVAFQNEDTDVWSSLDKRDDKLWTQEVNEVFIDANGDSKDYIELQVNPTGAIFDSYLPEYRKNQNDWNSTMKAAVKVDGTLNKREDQDKGWTTEWAIPWKDIKGRGTYALEIPPKVGAKFRVNFFRMDVPKNSPQLAAGWSPPMIGDFHALDKFGELVFGDEEGKAPQSETAQAGWGKPDDRPGVVRLAMPQRKTMELIRARQMMVQNPPPPNVKGTVPQPKAPEPEKKK